MTIDHIGIVVPSLNAALRQWEVFFGYHRNSAIVMNSRQQVRVVFLSKENSMTVKLIEPLSPESPAWQAGRRGGGLHHLCFRCVSIEHRIRLLQENGARLIVPPQPGEAFNNHPIAFLLAGNLNIELIDTEEKRGWGMSGTAVDDLPG